MKYFLGVNQKIWLEKYPKADIKTALIFDVVKNFCAVRNSKTKKLILDNEEYTWINYQTIINELPMMKFKSKGSISSRINLLKKWKLIKTFRAPDGSIYIRLTEKASELIFEPSVHLNEHPPVHPDEQAPVHPDEQHNQTTNINQTTNTSILSKDNIEEETSPKKTAKDNFSEEMKTLFLRAKEILNIQNWADTQKWNRIYATHCLKKWGLEKTLQSLEEIKKAYDREYYPDSFKDIYYTIARLENRKHREKTRRTIFIGHRDKDKTR
jgi:hypothetical protein